MAGAGLSDFGYIMSNVLRADTWSQPQSARSIFQFVSYQRVGLFTAAIEFLLVVLLSVATVAVYNFFQFGNVGDLEPYLITGIYSGLIFVVLSKFLGVYATENLLSHREQYRSTMVAWGGVALFLTSIFFVFQTGTHYSRAATVGFIFWGVFAILTVRALMRNGALHALDTGTLAGRRVIVIGDPEELTEISSPDLLRTYGAKEMDRFELTPRRNEERSSPRNDIDIVDAAIRSAQASNAEQILLAMRWSDGWRKDMICERLRLLPVPAFLLPDRSVRAVLGGTDTRRCSLTAIEVQRAPMSRQDLIVKRLFDLALASVGLIALSPLLLVTILAIKFDSPGPVIFRQRRRGFNGQQFSIYKFRTMTVLEDGPHIRQARKDDDRVTRLGRILRMSSIDELPQLFNVLRGEMSMVGPRPHAIAHDSEYSASIENYAFRHHVKPGITGWAQTHGFRGETPDLISMKQRIQLDLWYINNWSFWLDFRIVCRTTVELTRPRNAY